MEVESSICLSDLVPALRWSRPQQVAEALGDPRLPAVWWSSLALSRALGTAGLDWICERLARLASSSWDHLPLADLLPALTVHHIDPALPGWPEPTRTAITGLGGWQRLRRLSPSDLSTPSATPEVVIGSVFREILGRIPAQRESSGSFPAQRDASSPLPAQRDAAGSLPAQRDASLPGRPESLPPLPAGHPEVTRPLQRGSGGTGSFPAQPQSEPFAAQAGAQPEGAPPRQPTGPFPGQGDNLPQRQAASAEGPQQRQPGAFPAQPTPHQTGSFPAIPSEGTPPHQPETSPEGASPRQTGSFPAIPPEGTPPRRPGTSPEGASPRQTGSFPAIPPEGPQQRQPGAFPPPPVPDSGPQTGMFAAQPADGPMRHQTGSFPARQPESGPQRQQGSLPGQQPGGGPRQGLPGEPQRPGAAESLPGQGDRLPQRPAGNTRSGGPQDGSLPNPPALGGSAPGGPASDSPLPAGSGPATPAPGAPGSGGPHTGSMPAIPHTGSMPAIPGTGPDSAKGSASSGIPGASGTPGTPGHPGPVSHTPSSGSSPSAPAPSDTDHAMVRVVDSLFRSLDKFELAVAVQRLFAEDPISLRTLAHKMLVDREALSQAQRTAEERVLQWLRSSESAPVTGHMFRLTEWLGTAATEEQLIGADPAHPVMVPSLRTPLWRVLVTLMPDRRLQDGWLVVGDIHGLQARTRQLLAASPPDTDPVALMTELGIRAHSAKAWLDALPADAASDPVAAAAPAPAQPLPRRTPGANGHHHRGGQPIPTASSGAIDPSAALATLSALSGGRSSMLAGAPPTPPPPLPSPSSDPRRWQRIEVTPEHLRGGPVPVPEGYAAQLGMRPGTLLSVTGPGDNAIVLVWQGHQPVFDSLQPVLMRLNARPGDQVYVTVDGYRLEAQLTA
ncbi:hypothetical protein ABGB18_10795 [Nonomuraea sp. B12E4]|uniref:hypothetical protein n=1 Tax=Nonomuraea sp. B12E4 TaxID=3153564 RepID=UPI00325DF6B1